MSHEKIIVGISQGDINGIGLEVIIKTFVENTMFELCTPVLFGNNKTITNYCKLLKIGDFGFNQIKDFSEINHKGINIISVYEEDVEVELGQSTANGGKYAYKSLEAAAYALAQGKVNVLVTAPINKENIQSAEFNFPGHTEYLEDKFGDGNSLMLLVSENLKVAVVTGHIPLAQVSQSLTEELILKKINSLYQSLKNDFEIQKPKIAVLGVNPHAGDNGVIGNEEIKIISSAIEKAKTAGMLVYGTYPADGFFGNKTYEKFDAVLAMYHDQGLIPFKTLAFNTGVNFTAGLPIVRTSPDHGTAYDIAGKNIADETSFRNAVYTAIDVYNCRKRQVKLTANPLKLNPIRKEW